MKKLVLAALSLFVGSGFTRAEHLHAKKPDVLAICSETATSAPQFEILGDLNLFLGPRYTALVANVVLKNIHSRAVYDGVATLTKNAPYQYILNAFSTPSLTGTLTHSEEVSSINGVSIGDRMTLIKNRDGLELTSFSCTLNTGLLLNP